MKAKSFWIGVAVVLVIGFVYVRNQKGAQGLAIGNISGMPGWSIEYVLSNSSSRSGNVVAWIELNDVRMCEAIFPVAANTRYDMSIPCSTYTGGQFRLVVAWADSHPSIARIARPLRN